MAKAPLLERVRTAALIIPDDWTRTFRDSLIDLHGELSDAITVCPAGNLDCDNLILARLRVEELLSRVQRSLTRGAA